MFLGKFDAPPAAVEVGSNADNLLDTRPLRPLQNLRQLRGEIRVRKVRVRVVENRQGRVHASSIAETSSSRKGESLSRSRLVSAQTVDRRISGCVLRREVFSLTHLPQLRPGVYTVSRSD